MVIVMERTPMWMKFNFKVIDSTSFTCTILSESCSFATHCTQWQKQVRSQKYTCRNVFISQSFNNDASHNVSNFCPEHRIHQKLENTPHWPRISYPPLLLHVLTNKIYYQSFILSLCRRQCRRKRGEEEFRFVNDYTILCIFPWRSLSTVHILYISCLTNHAHKNSSYNLVTTTTGLAYNGDYLQCKHRGHTHYTQFRPEWWRAHYCRVENNCRILNIMEVQYLSSFYLL